MGPQAFSQSPLVFGLIASVVVVSILGWLSKPLYRAFVLSPHRVMQGFEVHRLLTAGWLHGDAVHLGLNMLTFYMFAGKVSQVFGDAKLVAFYVSAVVVAFIPTALRYSSKKQYTSIGASGAVAAIMFSAILLHPNLKLLLLLIPIPVPGIVFGVAYLAYSAWHSRSSGDGINHDAHFSGAIYGILVTFIAEPDRAQRALEALASPM